ncbi:MAG: hypothetical protein WD404_04335 [Solirubrobacterales bacterium]
MKLRIAAVSLALLTLGLALAASSSAAVVGIYRNSMQSNAQRGQVLKDFGERCGRGGSSQAFRIFVGKRTKECGYRTPVVGRDLEIAAAGRLLSSTPQPVQRRAFLSLNLRAGGNGARYQLAVFPLQRKAQLRKVLPDGKVEFLHVEKGIRTRGVNQANELRLRAFNVTAGPERGKCRILAFAGRRLVADVSDAAAGDLQGRASGFSVGAVGNAKGATGSFDDVVIRVPSPF